MSKAWAEHHGAELPSQLGDDKWDYAEAHANGTGPFKLEEFEPSERTANPRSRATVCRQPVGGDQADAAGAHDRECCAGALWRPSATAARAA